MRLAIAATMMAGLAMMVSAAMAQAPAPAGELQAGSPAPAFTLPGSDGATHTLADYKGKRAVVIAWYPKAFTGG